MRSFALAAGVVLTLVPLFAQQPAALETLRVHVVHGLTGNPLPDADVLLRDLSFERAVPEPVSTDAQGNVEFQVKPGGYALSADAPGVGTVSYGELDNLVSLVLQLPPGETSKLVTLAIFPRATVSGIVRDELGEPVHRASIGLLRAAWSDGGIHFAGGTTAETDDKGFYKIFNVRAGSYSVCAQAQVSQVPVIGVADFSLASVPRFYEPSCSPAPEPDLSSLQAVHWGEQVSVNFTLQSAPAIDVRGRLRNATDSPNLTLKLTHVQTWFQQTAAVARIASDGQTFVFHGVTPGKYQLDAMATMLQKDGGLRTEMAVHLPVDVRGASAPELDVALEPAPTMELAYDEAEPRLAERVVGVSLHAAGSPTTFSEPRPSGGKQIFDYRLTAGTYWLHHYLGKGACITGVKLGGQDVFRQPIHISSGMRERLVLSVSSACGKIEGRVVDGVRPVPRARVVILLSGSPEDPGFCPINYTGDNGEFEISGIAPGRYLLWAWKDDGSGTVPGPASLAALEPLATVVDLTAGTTSTPSVALLDLEGKTR